MRRRVPPPAQQTDPAPETDGRPAFHEPEPSPPAAGLKPGVVSADKVAANRAYGVVNAPPADEPALGVRMPEFAPGYGTIVETVFRVEDPSASYERLKRDLTFTEDQRDWRTDYGAMMEALNQAEANAQEAAELFSNAKVSLQVFEIDCDVFEGAMREKAMVQLNAEKKNGDRTKAITNDDVNAAAAMMFPEQWRTNGTRRTEMKETVRVIESLAERWKERHRALRVMLQVQRGAG